MKNNLGLKIVALLMAVFIWAQMTLVSQQETQTKLELRLVNASREDSLRQPPGKISSVVQGRGLDILRLKYSKAFIQMEAGDYWGGDSSDFQALDIPENLNVKVLSVSPPTPAQQIARVKTNQDTSPDDRGNSKDDSDSESYRPQTEDPPKVQTLILRDLPITPPPGVKIFPDKAQLKVQGEVSLLDKLPTGVSVTAVPDPQGGYELKHSVPQGITVLGITPQKVRAAR